jgi:hypothetical protein
MRCLGVAAVGLVAGAVGCVPLPPPDPGRPPPVPSTQAPPASTEAAVEWDARTGTIRCRSTKLVVPEALREQVRWTNIDELAIVPVGEPAGAALIVGLIEQSDSGGTDDEAADFVGDTGLTWIRLHQLAGGGLVGTVEMSLSGNTNFEESRWVADYTFGDKRGKAVYVEIDGCRVAALDFPLPNDRPRLTVLLDELQAKIAARFPQTIFERRERARFDAHTRRRD